MSKYRDYFSIDEEYFPSVNEDLLNRGLVDWTKFYPHATFVKLLKDTESVLSRNQKLSIWVEGAYGTGKSHAVLTLKKLLNASEQESKDYFQKYNLSKDLFNKIQGIKNQGIILTAHRYGASSIHNDNDLIIAIQESIKKALAEQGAEFYCEETLKGAIINWLSIEHNKNYLNSWIKDKYSVLFGSDDADSILNKLQNLNDRDLVGLIHNIFKVAGEIGITAFKLDIPGLIEWIKSVIKANKLMSIVFIWDEFTEYFQNNKNALTGFQQLAEMSETDPFYLIIVTHTSEGLFHDKDDDKIKILNRFVRPTCNIDLPENMAFKLMGAALQKREDKYVRAEWDEYADELNGNLSTSRNLIMNSAGITEDELKGILPIHPYTALMLKHLSSAFDSNQRSMFDFIKNNRGDDVEGFQWYIDNYGPLDDCCLVTIDMLWNFFYENGKQNLDPRIKSILDVYNRQASFELEDEQKRVFKTILLLQAISQKVGDTVEVFIPNDKNVANAYDGTDLETGRAIQIAERLVRAEVLYKKPTGANRFQYSAIVNAGDTGAVEKLKEQFAASKKTQDLIAAGNLESFFDMSGALKLRYVVKTASVDNVKRTANELRNDSQCGNNILAILTFAKNESERSALVKTIREIVSSDGEEIVFVDTSLTPLGTDSFEQYIDNLASSGYQRGKDNGLANQYDNMAQEVLNKWKERICNGEIVVFTKSGEERYFGVDNVKIKLKEINISKFPIGIENYYVISTMFDVNSLSSGANCGATQTVSGTFKSANPATKLENALNGAWLVDEYWDSNKNLLISKIKIFIEGEIKKAFEKEGRISIAQIYNALKVAPYGFMPCNLTAFILGFLLKEYAVESYTWSDGLGTDQMRPAKLKEMIDEIIKLQYITNTRYKDKYIVKMTEEEKAFRSMTAKVFNIPENECVSIENTRDRLRTRMKELAFPIWGVKEIIANEGLSVDKTVLIELIDSYYGVVNSANSVSKNTEIDIALHIGKLSIDNSTATDELIKLVTKENCRKGMIAYLQTFQNGELKRLADAIDDNGEYINVLKAKFDAEASIWVWSHETVEKKINEVILEYNIVVESNKIVTKSTSIEESIQEWCEKMNFFKLSFDTIKNDLNDLKQLFDCLIRIKRTGTIPDDIKTIFLEQLRLKSTSFNAYWETQLDMFKSKCSFQLNDMSDDQISKVFSQMPHGVFTKTNSEYIQLATDNIEKFKKDLGRTKLRELWYEKTGTHTPKEWSTTYQTPIFCMIDADYDKAKRAFDTINRNSPDEEDVNRALTFLRQTNNFDSLSSAISRDEHFKNVVVRDYSAMLNDITEVRKELSKRLLCDVYDWFPNPETDKIVKQFAELKYSTIGCDMALQLIEDMDPSTIKTYLKRLIRENINVGMEIINDK
jgi:hypothetical protein